MKKTIFGSLLVLMLGTLAMAQVPTVPPPPITNEAFAGLNAGFTLNTHYDPGWDFNKGFAISGTKMVRFFYRKDTGWFVGVLEDAFGNPLVGTQLWALPAGLDTLDLVVFTRPNPWSVSVVVSLYDKESGTMVKRYFYWGVTAIGQ